MRTKEFKVPEGSVIAFAEELTNRKMINSIKGIKERSLLIDVEYHKGEAVDIYELEELLDDLNDELKERISTNENHKTQSQNL